jgi:hypothetical protein
MDFLLEESPWLKSRWLRHFLLSRNSWLKENLLAIVFKESKKATNQKKIHNFPQRDSEFGNVPTTCRTMSLPEEIHGKLQTPRYGLSMPPVMQPAATLQYPVEFPHHECPEQHSPNSLPRQVYPLSQEQVPSGLGAKHSPNLP